MNPLPEVWARHAKQRDRVTAPVAPGQLELPFEVPQGRLTDVVAIPSLTPGTEAYVRWARGRFKVIRGGGDG